MPGCISSYWWDQTGFHRHHSPILPYPIRPPFFFREFLFSFVRERCKKNKEKKLTGVSFALTHTYTPVKTNIFPFFPQAYMEIFEKCAKTQKLKKQYVVPCCLWLLVFPPSFFGNLSLMFAKQLNNTLNLHYEYHQNTGVIRAIFHKCP